MLLQQDQRQVITQRIDPKIILANSILQLTSLELHQTIEAELMDNPALDLPEENLCEGNCHDASLCPYCMARNTATRETEPEVESLDSGDHELEYESLYGFMPGDGDEDYDPIGNLEAEMTLQEHLRSLLRSAVPEEDFLIGEYLINSINDKGWLDGKPENIALELGVDLAEVHRLLTIIQSFDPPGVGAQNLQECLLLQIRYLREENPESSDCHMNIIAEQAIVNHFEYFGARRHTKLARALGITVEEAKDTIEYIRARLNPFPANQFRPPWAYRPTNSKVSVRPDVIIRRTENGYEVEVLGAEPMALGINPAYKDIYSQIKTGDSTHSADQKKQVVEFVERAELFIRNINQRRQTLRQISRCIVDTQVGFLETGSRQFLRPLTRTQVARTLDIHESTVSRATANKFVQLPNQEVVEFGVFFNSSLSIKDSIEEIIQEEDPSNPLSDQQIVELLTEKGVTVARRTVVKYRESQKILSSTRRRR